MYNDSSWNPPTHRWFLGSKSLSCSCGLRIHTGWHEQVGKSDVKASRKDGMCDKKALIRKYNKDHSSQVKHMAMGQNLRYLFSRDYYLMTIKQAHLSVTPMEA